MFSQWPKTRWRMDKCCNGIIPSITVPHWPTTYLSSVIVEPNYACIHQNKPKTLTFTFTPTFKYWVKKNSFFAFPHKKRSFFFHDWWEYASSAPFPAVPVCRDPEFPGESPGEGPGSIIHSNVLLLPSDLRSPDDYPLFPTHILFVHGSFDFVLLLLLGGCYYDDVFLSLSLSFHVINTVWGRFLYFDAAVCSAFGLFLEKNKKRGEGNHIQCIQSSVCFYLFLHPLKNISSKFVTN